MQNFFEKHLNSFIIGAYILLTLILTTPVIFNITSDIPGGGDAFQVIAKPFQTIKNLEVDGNLNILKTVSHILYPTRIFDFNTHLLILHLIFGEPFSYNLLWLSSFVLAAFGTYLLVKYLTNSNIAAFVSGIIYSFSPLHFAYAMGFGGATHIEWIPFYILFLIKYIKKPSIKNILLTGIFFALLISGEPHFAAYSLLFTVVIFIYYFITNRKLILSKKFIIYSLIIGVVILPLLVLKYLPLIRVATSEENYLDPGLDQAINYSADSAGIITPSYLHPLWGDFFQKNVAYKFTGNPGEYTIYIGITVLFL